MWAPSNLQTYLLVKEILIFPSSKIILFLPFGLTVLSYFHITVVFLKIHSVGARLKAFFTTGSHLAVVTIYYGPAILMYMNPHSHLPRMRIISLQCCMIGWTHSLHSEKQDCERFPNEGGQRKDNGLMSSNVLHPCQWVISPLLFRNCPQRTE